MKRRIPLIIAFLLAPCAAIFAAAPAKPNILFIYTDDQAYSLGFWAYV